MEFRTPNEREWNLDGDKSEIDDSKFREGAFC